MIPTYVVRDVLSMVLDRWFSEPNVGRRPLFSFFYFFFELRRFSEISSTIEQLTFVCACIDRRKKKARIKDWYLHVSCKTFYNFVTRAIERFLSIVRLCLKITCNNDRVFKRRSPNRNINSDGFINAMVNLIRQWSGI